MSWYGQEVCLAVRWRKAFIGARDRWSASSRKLPTIVPVRARARMRALPRVGTLSDQFLDCVRLAILSSRHKGQTLEQVHVLFVLEQRAMERRNELFGIALAQGFRSDVFDHQEFEPIEKLGGGRLLLHSRHFADLVK